MGFTFKILPFKMLLLKLLFGLSTPWSLGPLVSWFLAPPLKTTGIANGPLAIFAFLSYGSMSFVNVQLTRLQILFNCRETGIIQMVPRQRSKGISYILTRFQLPTRKNGVNDGRPSCMDKSQC